MGAKIIPSLILLLSLIHGIFSAPSFKSDSESPHKESGMIITLITVPMVSLMMILVLVILIKWLMDTPTRTVLIESPDGKQFFTKVSKEQSQNIARSGNNPITVL